MSRWNCWPHAQDHDHRVWKSLKKSHSLQHCKRRAIYISKIKTRISTPYKSHYDVFGASFKLFGWFGFLRPSIIISVIRSHRKDQKPFRRIRNVLLPLTLLMHWSIRLVFQIFMQNNFCSHASSSSMHGNRKSNLVWCKCWLVLLVSLLVGKMTPLNVSHCLSHHSFLANS